MALPSVPRRLSRVTQARRVTGMPRTQLARAVPGWGQRRDLSEVAASPSVGQAWPARVARPAPWSAPRSQRVWEMSCRWGSRCTPPDCSPGPARGRLRAGSAAIVVHAAPAWRLVRPSFSRLTLLLKVWFRAPPHRRLRAAHLSRRAGALPRFCSIPSADRGTHQSPGVRAERGLMSGSVRPLSFNDALTAGEAGADLVPPVDGWLSTAPAEIDAAALAQGGEVQ